MRLIATFIFACLSVLIWSSKLAAQPLTPDQTAQLVNSIIKPVLQRNRVPGATVVLYNHGVPQAFYFGTASRNPYNHVNASTVFEIGSVTKIFTSVLLAYEANIGQVQLNDPVALYLRNAQATNRAFNQVTLQSLAAHVAGLGQMPSSTVKNRSDVMNSLRSWHPPYQVNTWWRYSNTGFGVLGYVLEDVSHKSYLALTRQVILNPLHMSDTGLVGNACFTCAQGHSWDGQPVTTTKTLLVIPAAGSVRSSGRDMLKFLAAALNLPGTPPVVAEAFRTTEMPYYETKYGAQGLGWEIHNFNKVDNTGYVHARYRTLTLHSSAAYAVTPEPQRGAVMFDKTGSVAGFRAYMALVPSSKTGIVILVNSAMPRTQVVLSGRKVLTQLVKGR